MGAAVAEAEPLAEMGGSQEEWASPALRSRGDAQAVSEMAHALGVEQTRRRVASTADVAEWAAASSGGAVAAMAQTSDGAASGGPVRSADGEAMEEASRSELLSSAVTKRPREEELSDDLR